MRLAVSVLAAAVPLIGAGCRGTLYLTIDTGSMKPAEEIAAVLRKHSVRATFFLADESTWRGDTALAAAWAPFWRKLAAEGHVFGSHTWRHWYFRGDGPNGTVLYVSPSGQRETLDGARLCAEIARPAEAFQQMTGVRMAPLWRAPGGRHTPRVLQLARACGWEHAGWSPAGFLGDELPSDRYPNRTLLERALARLRDGDILMMHLGIRSRQDPFWPMLDPLLAGLQAKGFCFATLPAPAAHAADVRPLRSGRMLRGTFETRTAASAPTAPAAARSLAK